MQEFQQQQKIRIFRCVKIIEAELANYAGFYQQYFANYDPLYADYFRKEYVAGIGKPPEAVHHDATAAVVAAYNDYNAYYNGYLESGYLAPHEDQGKKDGRPRNDGRWNRKY